MKLVDTNVLLYAVDELSEHHRPAREWIETTLSTGSRVLFPWIVLVGFIRLSTGRSFMADPLEPGEAVSLVEDWLAPYSSSVPVPDREHIARMSSLLAATGTGGNIVNDAHLAAIALQYDAEVISFDNDFSRFPGVRWKQPAQTSGR